MESLIPRVEEHLRLIAEDPESQAINHWRYETRNWLNQIEECLPHVGRKTAAQWQERLQAYREALGA